VVTAATDRASAWHGRRVLITGHTGFKGGWLALWLHRMGARLTGFALPPSTRPNLYEVAQVGLAFEGQTLADVRDADALMAALRQARPEVVFHLAAQPLVRASYADPLGTFATNVMGTAHLMEAVRGCDSVRAVVVVTSDKCYREGPGAHREDAPLGGHDPYSASKAGAELVTASYRDAYALPVRGVGVASARAGNVFGGGDWSPERLVPDLLQALADGVPVPLRRPSAVRPWQHVLEPLAGYILLAEHLLRAPLPASRPWNFGPRHEQAVTVLQLAQRLQAHARTAGHGTADPVLPEPAADGSLYESHQLTVDASQARQELGWRDQLDLDTALDWTWRWHHAWRGGQEMRAVTLAQIDDYRTRGASTR
jgi:CDP-glucose 4,6-dehydratase